jgi:hypothetical protein
MSRGALKPTKSVRAWALKAEARSNRPRRAQADRVRVRLGSQSRGKLERKNGLEKYS